MTKWPQKKAISAAAILLASCGSRAEPDVQLRGAWARPAAAGKPSTAAYLTIANTGGADRLLSVSTPAGAASLHTTTTDGGIMRMRPVAALDIGAGETVELRPGGLHIMVTGLRHPLPEGASVALLLSFERSGERVVETPVRSTPPQEDK